MRRSRSKACGQGGGGNEEHGLAGFFLALAWIALLAWQAWDHIAARRAHRETFERAGESSLGILEAAIRSTGQRRRQRPEFLDVIFREVFTSPGIRGAWLISLDGTPLYAREDPPAAASPEDFKRAIWLDQGVLVSRKVDVGVCPFDASGRRRAADSASQPDFLYLFLDREGVDRELSMDLGLRFGVQMVALVAVVGAYLGMRARSRARRLRTDLAVLEERARRHKEWALLGAGLAHETKNPLAVVRGIAQRLAAGEETKARDVDSALDIVDEVDRVVARLNEFLQYSKPLEPVKEEVVLQDLLNGVVGLVELDLAPSHGELVASGGDLVVLADRDQLRQILLNLLVNAAHALEGRGRVETVAEQVADGTVTLEVRDNGVGIASEDIEKVFEPYYTRAAGGTGLGLAIVRRLAEAHGWQVVIESEVAAGTVVRIQGIQRATT